MCANLKNGSTNWNLSNVVNDLQKMAASKALNALQDEFVADHLRKLSGHNLLQGTPYGDGGFNLEYEVLWQKGSRRLLCFGELGKGKPILCVPSLINRSYILDFHPERSFIGYLKQQGFVPLVVDWNNPLPWEYKDNIEGYIGVLDAMLSFLAELIADKVTLVGYCMGGIFSLALAQQFQHDVIDRLVLLCTPWDFHGPQFIKAMIEQTAFEDVKAILESFDVVPAELLQSLFTYLHFTDMQEYYANASTVDMSSKEWEYRIRLEYWLSDGVAMTVPVAKACLCDWVSHNAFVEGSFYGLEDRVVDPTSIAIPTLCVLPQYDHIVPKECGKPLLDLIADSRLLLPRTGHTGVMSGKAAPRIWHKITSFACE